MSIFRETFPQFIINELDRRQTGMVARTPGFLQELNTRSAWVRMTSGVNYEGSNALAEKYVLQGGTLLNNTSLRTGLGGDSTSTYDRLSPGGTAQRLGIRPMPGITNIDVQSKGAYGSLQEATVSFVAWDIKQLEELELLYMRPGYTVLLEFGWNYIKPAIPRYNILDIADGAGVSLQEAFKDIYQKITDSKGNYNALLGYVKNYNWSARDDGGYDCTTSIISLGEVLESLKCNWIPMETTAFSENGLLGYGPKQGNPDTNSAYELGIIPGLLKELYYYMEYKADSGDLPDYSRELTDSKFPGTKYQLFMFKRLGAASKINRGGLPKPLGTEFNEGYITLESFCDLINNYVLLKDQADRPLSQITTRETDQAGNIIPGSRLKCIASPLSLSTNYGICFVRNDNWKGLNLTVTEQEATEDESSTQAVATTVTPSDIAETLQKLGAYGKELLSVSLKRITPKIKSTGDVYRFEGDIKATLEQIASDLLSAITDIKITKDQTTGNLLVRFTFFDGNSFVSTATEPSKIINFFDYFYTSKITGDLESGNVTSTSTRPSDRPRLAYNDLFRSAVGNQFFDNTKKWSESELITLVQNIFSKQSLSGKLQELLNTQLTVVASAVSEVASNVPGLGRSSLQFLVENTTSNTKALGYIGNIYVNINFLYSQAISKNVASTDIQNKNTISIREYLQSILREIQNSLGNVNNFDIQVDDRNAIGRIIDINYTGDPELNSFVLQVHNLNSVVRDYKFQSKIFPEMGSIIAISAQDATGVGKLGYDNATLVAWNEGIKDRLLPKKDFTNKINIGNSQNPVSFIFPFLSKIYTYFQSLNGDGKSNVNLVYGGLDFAYRDFLANLNRFDPQNKFSAIIPTELSVTMDGIGGIVIGNIFRINQDIIPKGYKGSNNREIAYIVAKLGHSIQDNDWVTNIQAYPIVLSKAQSTEVWKKWKNQQYPGASITITGANGQPLVQLQSSDSARLPKNSNIPVIKYLQGLGRENGRLIITNKDKGPLDLAPVNKNNNKQLFPSAAKQWEALIASGSVAGFKDSDMAISNAPGAAYRSYEEQVKTFAKYGPGKAAEPGTSVHGWGAAVDIQSLYTAAGGSIDPATNANVRNNNLWYKWLDENAADFGWINPPQLKDGVKTDEAWHWEYWGPVSGGAIGDPESIPTVTTISIDFIVSAIRDATAGFGTNVENLIEGIELIKDKATFTKVNSRINITELLASELERDNKDALDKIKKYLATIQVELKYSVRQFGFRAFDITIKT
jgi:LAS superfamily LD-carboxypeptidase LdcB